MKRLLLVIAVGCGGDEPAEQVIDCDYPTVKLADAACRISTDALEIDQTTQCVWVHEGDSSYNGMCISAEVGFVTIKNSYMIETRRGALVRLEDELPSACVFRECMP